MRFTPRDRRSAFARFVREGHRQALNDVHARWRIGGSWLLVVVWFVGLCLCLATVSLISSDGLGACQPDGSFEIYPQRYQFWSSSGIFQITLGYGNLSFTEAKIIDITWDIVCGRGGQAVLMLVSWHVFANYLTTSMEVGPVTFNTYRTVFLQNQPQIVAIPRLVQDFTRRRGLHSKIAMVFMVATMVFILVLPSFASAMTGYSGNVKAFVPDKSNNYLSFKSFRHVLYVVHDGWRINKTGDYAISYGPFYDEPIPAVDETIRGEIPNYPCNRDENDLEVQEQCRIQQNVTDYITRYGFYGLGNSTSTFLNFTLEPPVLNISASYLPFDHPGSNWIDPRTQNQPFKNASRRTWIYGNDTYDMDYIESRGSCQPVGKYKWGFSFIQLNVMIILCIIWTIGIVTMWTRSHFTMKRRGRTDVAGEYKAVLELAAAMSEQLLSPISLENSDILTLTESNLRSRIKEDLQGGSMTYETSLSTSEGKRKCDDDNDDNYDASTRLRGFLAKERWWFGAILGLLGVGYGLFLSRVLANSLLCFSLSASPILTMCIGCSAVMVPIHFMSS